jgi:hypothetical protein
MKTMPFNFLLFIVLASVPLSSCKDEKAKPGEYRVQHSKAKKGAPLEEPRICSPAKISSCSASYNKEKQQIDAELLKKAIQPAAKGWKTTQIKIVNRKAHAGGCDQRMAEATLTKANRTLLLRLTDGIHTCECEAPNEDGKKKSGGGGIDSTFHQTGKTSTLQFNIPDCCSLTIIDENKTGGAGAGEAAMADAAKVADLQSLRKLCRRF